MVDTTWIPRAEQVARLTLEVAGLKERLAAHQDQVRQLEHEVARQTGRADRARRAATQLRDEIEAIRSAAPDPAPAPDTAPHAAAGPATEPMSTGGSLPVVGWARRLRRTGA